MPDKASEARDPRLGIGIDTPIPRKLRKLSVKIADGICRAVEMIITLIQFGSKCFKITLSGFAPMDFAANMYSCCLMDRI